MSDINFSAVKVFNDDGVDAKLQVKGSVLVFTEDTEVSVSKSEVQGLNPNILLLELKITPKPGPMKGIYRDFVFEIDGDEAMAFTHVQIVGDAVVSNTVEVNRVRKLLYVNEVDTALLKSNPPKLSIIAYGSAPTTSWSDVRLLPKGINPVDGYFELDLIGTPPIGAAGEMITPVIASYIWEEYSPQCAGIRIFAALNFMELNLADERKEVEFVV